jgi:superfamily II DNA or RNA helicase
VALPAIRTERSVSSDVVSSDTFTGRLQALDSRMRRDNRPMTGLPPAAHTAVAHPRLLLRTWGRGDGLLGLRPFGGVGPRGPTVSVVQLPAADADAVARLQALGFVPVPADALQWRSTALAAAAPAVWTLPQEAFFGDFWAEQVPQLQAEGWSIVVAPGFAHQTVPVQAWRLVLEPGGDALGHEVAGALARRPPRLRALTQPHQEGSWMLSLGLEVEGEVLDLAPLLADLLRRDARWLKAAAVAAIADDELILLRLPSGRRIEARAAPLKAIVASMLELLTDPQRTEGPLQLSDWDARRIEQLRVDLLGNPATRPGAHGAWQLQGDAGLAALARRLKAAGVPAAVPEPAGLGLRLRSYQLEGLAWLQHLRVQGLGGILADDMGLGKTAQALAHVLAEQQAGRLDQPALVVLPTSLIFNWQAEAQRVAPPLRVLTLHGPERAGLFDRIGEHDLVLTTYPLLLRDIRRFERQRWHLLVLDEAQTVKNAGSRGARAVRRLDARHRLCLTGTPLENHLGELWAQFDFLMPGFLGTARGFKRQWRDPIERNGETLRAQLLAQRLKPFMLRRRKADVATELPPRTEIVRRVSLQGEQRALYESVRVAAHTWVRRALDSGGFKGAQIAVLDALLKLRQVCCDPWLLKGELTPPTMPRAKLEWLRDTLPTLAAEGRRMLVFSQFSRMLTLLQPELDAMGLPWLSLTGDTPSSERGTVVERFQTGTVPVLLISLKAGGVGLNLTAADTVIHLDPWWNPAVEEQASARAHRIGQDQPVFVYKLVVEGSIEERVLALQQRKAVLADAVLGRDGEGSRKFSSEELDGLLAPLDTLSFPFLPA